MALTADTVLTEVIDKHSESPILSAATIYEGAMLGDSSGYVRGLVAGDKFRGHSLEYVVNPSGGDRTVEHLTGKYRLKVTLSGVLITDVKRLVYASADDTLTFTATGNSYVGTVVRYVTTNTAIVEFDTGGLKLGFLAYSNIAGATSVENTASETDFDKSVVLDGASLEAGDVIHIRGDVWVEDQNSTNTLTLKLYVGTEVVWNSGAVVIADNDRGVVDVNVTVAVIGASGKLIWQGIGVLGVPGTKVPAAFGQATAAGESENLSGSVPVKMSATFSAAHADNECELRSLVVEILKAKAA